MIGRPTRAYGQRPPQARPGPTRDPESGRGFALLVKMSGCKLEQRDAKDSDHYVHYGRFLHPVDVSRFEVLVL